MSATLGVEVTVFSRDTCIADNIVFKDLDVEAGKKCFLEGRDV